MIIADHTFKNKHEILKMVGKKFEALLKGDQLTEEQAAKIQEDIEETLVKAFAPISFTKNLETFCKKHQEFQEVWRKTKNLNQEYLQDSGNKAIDTLIDEDPVKWQEAAETLTEVDENNFDQWASGLPTKARGKFTEKLITS